MKTHSTSRNLNLPRPFLKWAGGKRQLLPELMKRVEMAGDFGRYHEPFVGGGALFFELMRTNRLSRKQAWLSDNNGPLIETYHGVREAVEEVIALLRQHESGHGEDYYYEVRAGVPQKNSAERAARIIYLNKTGYNGLYRENSKGQFNVPFGRYKKPLICDEPNLRAVAETLRKAKIERRPFDSILRKAERKAEPGDLVYFDPPYHPISKTASFTAYDKGGFPESSQRELAEVFAKLSAKGVKVLLSNSMTGFVRDLYSDFQIDEVLANRNVNSRADRRGKVKEALVRNF